MAQPFEVSELADDAAQGATGDFQPRPHPGGVLPHAGWLGLGGIKAGPLVLPAIAEAVRQDLVIDVVAPDQGAGEHPPPGVEVEVGQIPRDFGLNGGGPGEGGQEAFRASCLPGSRWLKWKGSGAGEDPQAMGVVFQLLRSVPGNLSSFALDLISRDICLPPRKKHHTDASIKSHASGPSLRQWLPCGLSALQSGKFTSRLSVYPPLTLRVSPFNGFICEELVMPT